MKTKYCNACQQTKPLTEFGIMLKGKDGHRNICRKCFYRRRREGYLRNLEQHREYTSQYRKQYRLTPRGRYNALKASCYKTGKKCSFTGDEFVAWLKGQPQICYYCGGQLVNNGGRGGLTTLTIDRKDNSRGYDLDNIALACRRCNSMKGNWLTEQQTLEIAERYFR